ncbi:CG6012, partial [Drosophila busckii]
MFAWIYSFLAFVGGYALLCYLYEQLRTPWILLRESGDHAPSLRHRFGSWAAITGSSDGIGKAYAKELARQGINVVLIARNEQKLQAECNVQTKIIVADFTQGVQIYKHIEEELKDLPLAILVNNVGMGMPGNLIKYSSEQVQQLLETNVLAVSHLSHYFLQHLRASKIKGALVNVSSGTELQPVPYAALYAASKAFTRSFTLALQWEAARHGILVQLLSPNFVVTKINNYSKRVMQGGLFIPTPEQYARSAVAQLRAAVDATPGYFWHHIQNAAMTAFPWRLRLTLAQLFFSKLTDKQ